MEDDEDYAPMAEGYLELRYRGLTDVEPRVWIFSHRLLHLDVSFNQLQCLPTEIGSLTLLQELNVSCNKLVTLPIEIGPLAWLQVLKAMAIISLQFRAKSVNASVCKSLSFRKI